MAYIEKQMDHGDAPQTVSQAVGHADDERMSRDTWKVLVFVFLAWVIDAADSTIYSLTLPSIRSEFNLSLSQMGLIASIFLLGTVLGALFLPIVADRYGRRVGMITCISIFSAFTGFIGIAQNGVMVALGRFLTGCGTGAEWPIGAAYLSEVVPAKRRGFAMGIMQAGYPVGFFLAGGIVALFGWLGLGWRACYVFLAIPALMCIPIAKMLKESPSGRAARLAANASPARLSLAQQYRALFNVRYRRYTLIATAIHVFGAIFSYGLVVWIPSAITIDFHLDKIHTAEFVMFAWGVGALGYLAAGRLADRFGRKATLTAYTLLGVGAVLYLNYLHWQRQTGFIDLLLPGAMIGMSLGVSAIYITYTSEIFPAHLRTMGLGFSVAIGKVTALFVPVVLGVIAQSSSITLSLLLSTGIGVMMIPAIFCGPETAGKRLEDITR